MLIPHIAEIQRAARILAEMKNAHADARGAFGLDMGDGKTEMIDAPMLKQVETLLV